MRWSEAHTTVQGFAGLAWQHDLSLLHYTVDTVAGESSANHTMLFVSSLEAYHSWCFVHCLEPLCGALCCCWVSFWSGGGGGSCGVLNLWTLAANTSVHTSASQSVGPLQWALCVPCQCLFNRHRPLLWVLCVCVCVCVCDAQIFFKSCSNCEVQQ